MVTSVLIVIESGGWTIRSMILGETSVENLVPQTARQILEGVGCQGIVEKLMFVNAYIAPEVL